MLNCVPYWSKQGHADLFNEVHMNDYFHSQKQPKKLDMMVLMSFKMCELQVHSLSAL